MKKYIEKLQYITHDNPKSAQIEQVQVACEAGAKWIQYRCLTKSDEDLINEIKLISEICDDWGTTLIVTDHIHLRDKIDVQGFHIEDMDADFLQIRAEIGEQYTLGGSANTIENLVRLCKEGADYMGFGPFSFTNTKPNDLPQIGYQGYTYAKEQLTIQQIETPIFAVGGVNLIDVESLLATGIYGIAVSSAILNAPNMYQTYLDFYHKIK